MAARVLIGLGGAGVIVMAFSVLTVLFSQQERPKAVGVMAGVTFVAFPIGPILGGWLLSSYWWGWVFLINVPVVAVSLVAVIAMVPESRAAQRPGLDLVGVAASAAGLVSLTYGLIEAGQHGWSDAGALVLMIAGVALLAGFLGWERRLTRRPGGQPLIDLSLFCSASFTWGVILAVVPILAMLGILFTMPQYFQGVLGTSAMGSGLRLLPLVGGLLAGAVPAARVVRLVGAKVAVTAGFALLAAGLFTGAMTGTASSGLFVGAWMAVAGLGTGIAMATAMSAALVELSADKSGVGAAVMQAVNKTGGPLGIAILGSVLSVGYLGRLHLSGLPPAAAAAVRQSVFGGVAVASRLHSAALLASVKTAFVHGMDLALVVSAGIAVAGVVLTLVFLPASNATEEAVPPGPDPDGEAVTMPRTRVPSAPPSLRPVASALGLTANIIANLVSGERSRSPEGNYYRHYHRDNNCENFRVIV
jgi:hypothetical protein